MKEHIVPKLEAGIKEIGNQIKLWREDSSIKKILEPNAFKTKADTQADFLLKKLIGGLDFETPIISEEDKKFHLNRPNQYWLIDPIDGTASWYNGFDGFVTQIAYIENGVAVYGAVYAPVLDKFWSAKKGKGAYLNGNKLPCLKPRKSIILVDNYPEPNRVAKKIYDNLSVTKYLECGSLGLKSCLVADGTADLFVKDIVIKDWDVAPVAIILEEVKGVLRDFKNNPIVFSGSFENNGLIVARDEMLVTKILSLTKGTSC